MSLVYREDWWVWPTTALSISTSMHYVMLCDYKNYACACSIDLQMQELVDLM